MGELINWGFCWIPSAEAHGAFWWQCIPWREAGCDTHQSPLPGSGSTCIQHFTTFCLQIHFKGLSEYFFFKYHCMILNYVLMLTYANQKLLGGTKTKKSSPHLHTSNSLCHLNLQQGMSYLNDNPQVSFPSTSTSNIWGIILICFLRGNLTRIWSNSPVESEHQEEIPTPGARRPVLPRAQPGDTELWWQEHGVPTRLCWVL